LPRIKYGAGSARNDIVFFIFLDCPVLNVGQTKAGITIKENSFKII